MKLRTIYSCLLQGDEKICLQNLFADSPELLSAGGDGSRLVKGLVHDAALLLGKGVGG